MPYSYFISLYTDGCSGSMFPFRTTERHTNTNTNMSMQRTMLLCGAGGCTHTHYLENFERTPPPTEHTSASLSEGDSTV